MILLQDVSSIFPRRCIWRGVNRWWANRISHLWYGEVDDTDSPPPPTYLVHKRMANGERVAIIDSTRFVTTYVCPRRWWRCTRGAIRLIRTWATRGTQVDTYGPVCVYSTRHNLAKWQNTRWRAILVHRGGLDARGWCGYWRGFYGRTELNIWVLGCRTQRG